jgi:hypothetical protein
MHAQCSHVRYCVRWPYYAFSLNKTDDFTSNEHVSKNISLNSVWKSIFELIINALMHLKTF